MHTGEEFQSRILLTEKVLTDMDYVKLYALPKTEPWTLDRFLEEIKDACKDGAADLNRKSVMIEDAVEDLIGLAMQALNLPDPESFDENNSNVASNHESEDEGDDEGEEKKRSRRRKSKKESISSGNFSSMISRYVVN